MRDMATEKDRIGKRNLILAGAAGVFATLAILVFGIPGLDPSMWDEVAVAAGLRPPRAIFPGLWRILTGWLFSLFGVAGALGVLKFAGAVAGGVCVALVSLIVRQVLALLVRTGRDYRIWFDRLAPFFALLAAVLFGLGDPLWRIARMFSPDELRLLLLLTIVYLSLRWFTVGGNARVFVLSALMGVLSAETPFGFLLPVAFVGFFLVVWHCVMDGLFSRPNQLPSPLELPKWRMLFLFLCGIALTAWINVREFTALGGVSANGWQPTYVYFLYGASYWRVLTGAASLIGWLLGIGFCVIPLVVSIRILPQVLRDDRPMPFVSGVLMLFVGLVALMQTGVLTATRFWTFSREIIQVRSGFLLAFFVLCAIMTVAFACAAFAFECQRFYLIESEDVPRPGRLLRELVPSLGVLLIVLALFAVPKPVESEMQRIVDEAVVETVDECEDAQWVFTDGRLDAALEIEAARRELPLRPLNMMSGGSPWDVTLCRRGFKPGTDDCQAAETSIPSLLRMWAGEKPNGMDEAAVQIGFEFWKRERKKLPKASGLVARTKWTKAENVDRGIKRAEALGQRIVDLGTKIEEADPTPALANAFVSVSWRISRLARLRSDAKLADALDRCNSALKRMLSAVEYERMRTFLQLTPKEGLELALKRANFVEASRYAAAVLRQDPDNPEGNFALGMAALTNNRLKDAEHYLSRCLKRRPDEPAVLNNLSVIFRRERKYKEAEEYARRAIKLLPNSPEVKQTLEDALKKAP